MPPPLPTPHQAAPFMPPPPNAHPPLPMPPPPEMQALMDKTAQKAVSSQNTLEFEQMIRNKQTSNLQFAFLFRGHPYNHYYEFRKVTLRQQLQQQQNKGSDSDNDQSINVGMTQGYIHPLLTLSLMSCILLSHLTDSGIQQNFI